MKVFCVTAPGAAARFASILLSLALCVLLGCGGSGSSGFDGEPASEPQAIENAVERGSCETFAGQTYCGSGAPFTSDDVTGEVAVDEPLTPVVCTEVPIGDTCVTSVAFTSEGFPAGTTYFAASSDSFEGPWVLSSDMPAPGTGDPEEQREAQVELPTAGTPPSAPTPLIVAVLVYFDPIEELPNEAAMLADFAADVVYVTRELEVDVEP